MVMNVPVGRSVLDRREKQTGVYCSCRCLQNSADLVGGAEQGDRGPEAIEAALGIQEIGNVGALQRRARKQRC